jgi:hypothetical protein
MSSSLASLTSQRLRDLGVEVSQEAGGSLRIAGPNAAIGDAVVSFDDGEISVFIGDITHCHFTPVEAQGNFPALTPEQAADQAATYLREVLADEWVIWRWGNGSGGCYKPDGDDWESADAPLQGEDVERFFWSGARVPPNNKLQRTRGGSFGEQ